MLILAIKATLRPRVVGGHDTSLKVVTLKNPFELGVAVIVEFMRQLNAMSMDCVYCVGFQRMFICFLRTYRYMLVTR